MTTAFIFSLAIIIFLLFVVLGLRDTVKIQQEAIKEQRLLNQELSKRLSWVVGKEIE